MKNALLVNKFYHPDIGGVETIVKQYAEELSKSYNVTVLCIKKEFSLKTNYEIINNVNIIRCSSFGTFFSMPISLSFFFFFLNLKTKSNVIHFHEPFPIGSLLSILNFNKTKIVVTWHSDIIKQKFLKKIVEIFQHKLCEKSNVITATSPQLISFSSVLKSYKNKVKVLPLSIDLVEYKLEVHNQKNNYILYLGRLSYYKGIDLLLEAYENSTSKLPLFIVGDGEPEIVKSVNEFIIKSKKKIIFINEFVSEKKKNDYIKGCMFLVFPSIYNSEAFGIVQLEAMSYSKPVLNTNLQTGVPWVSVHNVTGITVPVENVDELTKAIDKLSSLKLASKLGLKARQRVEQMFTDDIILKKLNQIYK
jgi:glycosyltransferase involved in cell wall biosynthesis